MMNQYESYKIHEVDENNLSKFQMPSYIPFNFSDNSFCNWQTLADNETVTEIVEYVFFDEERTHEIRYRIDECIEDLKKMGKEIKIDDKIVYFKKNKDEVRYCWYTNEFTHYLFYGFDKDKMILNKRSPK
jgi:hypothetical protein